MKKLLAIIGVSILTFASFANNDKEVVKSSITNVTVYTQGAQIYRTASYSVKPGITQLVIEGISPNIDPKSLQVKASGSVVLIDSKYNLYYPKPEEVKLEGLPLKIRKDIKLLEDSLSNLDFEINELQDEIDVLRASKSILSNNGAIRGQGKVNDSIQLLKQALDYYQLKMNEINKKLQSISKRKSEKDFRKSGMLNRLNDLKNYQNSNTPVVNEGPIHQIVITVQSKELMSGKLSVSYLVSGASWVPTYDLRSDIATGKVNLTYKANVSQNTGEKWDDIRLTLSTNNPYQNKTKPELHPWYVDYYNQGGAGRLNNMSVAPSMPAKKESVSDSYKTLEEKVDYDAESAYDFTTMVDRVLSAEYKIDLPYTIESDGEEHFVLVKNVDLNAKYRYYTVPKVDPGVFLVAEIVKLDELQLVPATANIFFDGTYMGETYIDPTMMNDTLKLSLGKDPNIIAKRILLKKEMKEKIVGNDKERTFAYEISIKNLKGTNVELVIEDQLPVTTNGDIVIEPIGLDKAEYDKVSGKLVWVLNLKPKEADKKVYSFKVRHPKDQNVVIQ